MDLIELEELQDTVKAAVWKTFGDKMKDAFPDARSGDLSPDITGAVDDAIAAAVEEWAEANAGMDDVKCGQCGTPATPDDRGTTCRECGRGIIE